MHANAADDPQDTKVIPEGGTLVCSQLKGCVRPKESRVLLALCLAGTREGEKESQFQS